MYVARILVRTQYCLVLNQTFNMEVNANVHMIKIIEDNYGPKRIVMAKEKEYGRDSNEDSEQDDDYLSLVKKMARVDSVIRVDMKTQKGILSKIARRLVVAQAIKAMTEMRKKFRSLWKRR